MTRYECDHFKMFCDVVEFFFIKIAQDQVDNINYGIKNYVFP
jgi:hypothetical protein